MLPIVVLKIFTYTLGVRVTLYFAINHTEIILRAINGRIIYTTINEINNKIDGIYITSSFNIVGHYLRLRSARACSEKRLIFNSLERERMRNNHCRFSINKKICV